jgi:hypothetical protein
MNALALIRSARPLAPGASDLVPPLPGKGFALRISSWRLLRHVIRIAKWGNFAVEFLEVTKLAIDVIADLFEWVDG